MITLEIADLLHKKGFAIIFKNGETYLIREKN